MSYLDMECEICEKEFKADEYGSSKCPNCDQFYLFTESVEIVLSDDQIKLLRNFEKIKKKVKGVRL